MLGMDEDLIRNFYGFDSTFQMINGFLCMYECDIIKIQNLCLTPNVHLLWFGHEKIDSHADVGPYTFN